MRQSQHATRRDEKSGTVIFMKMSRICLSWLFWFFCLGCLHFSAMAQTPQAQLKSPSATGCPAILQHAFARLQDEAPQNLCQFSGKVVLVVNTASYCGFTSQYEGLEALYAKYQSKGLVVLGFPSNDFGKQEPGSAKEIADLCFNTYGVKFPMFAKSVVSGKQANALYLALASSTGKAPQWNFHKYLIDRRGKVIASFASEISPQSTQLLGPIEQALAQKL
jgi:glutathione peroxidase